LFSVPKQAARERSHAIVGVTSQSDDRPKVALYEKTRINSRVFAADQLGISAFAFDRVAAGNSGSSERRVSIGT